MFSLTPRSVSELGAARDPLSLMDLMFSDWLRAQPTTSMVSRARLEVSEHGNVYEVRAELPGAAKEDISVDIDGARVSISAKADSHAEKKDGTKLLYSERSHESFSRSFELPRAVDAATASARFENGVLILTLPKRDNTAKSTRLAIK